MLNLFEWTCIFGAGASVGAPLVYAIGTLDGLHHKTVYPLFRFIKHDRYLSSAQTPL